MLFLYEDVDIGRFSNLHQFTFKNKNQAYQQKISFNPDRSKLKNNQVETPNQRHLSMLQYNALLTTISAIRVTSKEKLYQKLNLKSLQHRRCFRKLYKFYKICKNQSSIISSSQLTHQKINIRCLHFIHNLFKTFFYILASSKPELFFLKMSQMSFSL